MTYAPALAQRWFPARTWYREVAVVFAGAALIAALARLTVPLWPVPVTGQTLGVLLVGGGLGFRRAVSAVGLYIAAGACGLPLFAAGTAGFAVLFGATGGYLIGFLAAAGTMGLAAEHGFLNRYLVALGAAVVATVPIFAFGLAWLSSYVPHGTVLEQGFYPFIPGAIAKVCLAAILLPAVQSFTARRARS